MKYFKQHLLQFWMMGVCSKFAQVVHFMSKNESVHIIRAVCCCCYGKGVW